MNRRDFSRVMAGFAPLLLSGSARSILFDSAQPATQATPALRKFVTRCAHSKVTCPRFRDTKEHGTRKSH
jgi:hypothetical protein